MQERSSAAQCQYSACNLLPYDNCQSCHKPTCLRHGKVLGYREYIIFRHCGDNAPSLIAALQRRGVAPEGSKPAVVS